MKRFALVGRTFGATYYDTYEEAIDDYYALPDSVIELDGEVMIYRLDGDKWVDARDKQNMGKVWKERIAEIQARHKEREEKRNGL